MQSRTDCKIAVIARCHKTSNKFSDLISSLQGHESFDFYVSANHSNGPIELGAVPTLPYTLEDMRALGFSAPEERFLYQCGDALIEHWRRCIPDYDFYVHIEYDLQFARERAAFMDAIASKLRSPEFRDVDVCGNEIIRRYPGCFGFNNASALFKDVHAVLFSFVIFSRRAVSYVYEQRLRLEGANKPTDERIFCETLVASSMKAANGFRIIELADMFPGCFDRRYYYWGLPMLFEQLPPLKPDIELLHPVYGGRDCLEAHYWYALHSDTLRQHCAVMETANLPIAPDVLASAIQRAHAALPKDQISIMRTDQNLGQAADLDLSVVFLATRSACLFSVGERSAATVELAGRTVAAELLRTLSAQGCREFTVVLDDNQLRETLELAMAEAALSPMKVILLDQSVPSGDQIRLALATAGGQRSLLVHAGFVADLNLEELLALHEREGKLATIMMVQPPALSLALQGKIATSIDEIPRFGQLWVKAGMMILEPEARPYLQNIENLDEAIGTLDSVGELAIFEHRRFWQGLSNDYDVAALRHLLEV